MSAIFDYTCSYKTAIKRNETGTKQPSGLGRYWVDNPPIQAKCSVGVNVDRRGEGRLPAVATCRGQYLQFSRCTRKRIGPSFTKNSLAQTRRISHPTSASGGRTMLPIVHRLW
jgi:hypothetical protein